MLQEHEAECCELCQRPLPRAFVCHVCAMCRQEFDESRRPDTPEGSLVSDEESERDPRSAEVGEIAEAQTDVPPTISRNRNRASNIAVCLALTFALMALWLARSVFLNPLPTEELASPRALDQGDRVVSSVPAAKICEDFRQDRVAADAKWWSKDVIVHGTVNQVTYTAPGSDGRLTIVLDGDGVTGGMRCAFGTWDADLIDTIKPGEVIVVRGAIFLGYGGPTGAPGESGNVVWMVLCSFEGWVVPGSQ